MAQLAAVNEAMAAIEAQRQSMRETIEAIETGRSPLHPRVNVQEAAESIMAMPEMSGRDDGDAAASDGGRRDGGGHHGGHEHGNRRGGHGHQHGHAPPMSEFEKYMASRKDKDTALCRQ